MVEFVTFSHVQLRNRLCVRIYWPATNLLLIRANLRGRTIASKRKNLLFTDVHSLAAYCEECPAGEGLAIGWTVALNLLWSGPISGASINTAPSFGPVLISGEWTAYWIYWVGPIVGAVFGASANESVRPTEPGDA